jgi:hypothetical protein
MLGVGGVLQDDSRARSVLARIVSHDNTPQAQAADKLSALTTYLGLDDKSKPGLARPPRVQAAHALADDLRGTGTIETRLQVDSLYLAYWSAVDSLPALRAAAETLLATYQHGPAARVQAHRYPRYVAYRALMRVAFFSKPDSAAAVVRRAMRDSLDLFSFSSWTNAASLSEGQVTKHLSPMQITWPQFQTGQAPVVYAARSYPAAGRASGEPVFPVPGKVSLFIAGGGAHVAAIIRKWRARYDPQQLAITVFDVTDDTAAYWWQGNDENLIDGPLSVSARGDRARWYYREYEHLPVDVALEVRQVQFGAWPFDRKTVASPQPLVAQFFDVAHEHPRPGTALLADRTGKLVWIGNPRDESAAFDRLLAWTISHTEDARRAVQQ